MRNLIEFFTTTVYFDPSEFTVPGCYEQNRSLFDDSILRKLNKQISHLTPSRTRNDRRSSARRTGTMPTGPSRTRSADCMRT